MTPERSVFGVRILIAQPDAQHVKLQGQSGVLIEDLGYRAGVKHFLVALKGRRHLLRMARSEFVIEAEQATQFQAQGAAQVPSAKAEPARARRYRKINRPDTAERAALESQELAWCPDCQRVMPWSAWTGLGAVFGCRACRACAKTGKENQNGISRNGNQARA